MRGGIALEVDAVVIPGDHGVVEDGDGTYRYLSLFSSPASLGDGLGHEELVVHRSSDETCIRPFDSAGGLGGV